MGKTASYLVRRAGDALVTLAFMALFVTGVTYAALNYLTAVSTGSSGTQISSTEWNKMVANFTTVDAQLTTALAAKVPTWAVMAFNLTTCPTWWTEADGGGGRPNLRGQFVRGWNSTATGIDPSRWFGTVQNGSLVMNDIPQTQRVFSLVGTSLFYDAPQLNASASYGWTQYQPGSNITGTWWNGVVDANYVGATRPTNVALLYCVKN